MTTNPNTFSTITEPPRQKGLVQPLTGRHDRRGPRIVDGKGCLVTFEDGVEAIDAAAQDSSVILGHRHPELVAAVREAADMVFASDTASGFPMKDALVADYLGTVFADARWISAVRLTCTGSEAIDIGLALAQALTGRQGLAARQDSYHGAVGLARDATRFEILHGGLSHPEGGFTPGPVNAPIIAFSTDALPPHDVLEAQFRGAAAVLTDCGSGHVYPPAAWFNAVGRAAKAAGALWLHDETVTGYGRTGGGKWFHALELDERPDMIAAGKCVTGGAAPGSVLFLSDRVVDWMDGRRWAVGSTFWGHPLTLATMRKVIEIVHRDGHVVDLPARGERLGARLEEVARLHQGIVQSVAGTGFNRTIRLHGSAADHAFMGDGSHQPIAARAMEAARLNGVSTPAYGPLGLWIVPPFTMSDAEIDRLADGLDRAFRTLTPTE
jgi:4-aminobutyrate aminotransferase-like enzyme